MLQETYNYQTLSRILRLFGTKKTLILYDDVELGSLTRQYIGKLGEENKCKLEISHCYSPLLDMPRARDLMLEKAKRADVVFVAFAPENALEGFVENWVYSWSRSDYPQQKAVVALSDREIEDISWYEDLKKACDNKSIQFSFGSFPEF